MKIIFRLLGVVVFLGGLSAAWGGAAFAQGAGQQFEGFNLQGYEDDGRMKWDLRGDTADVFGEQISITNVDANHYGDQAMNLKAKIGKIDKASGDIRLERDVVITSEQGRQMKTESLDWYKEKDIVETEDKVLLSDQRLTAVGTGMRASPGLMVAQMKKDVTVQVKPQPEEPDSLPVTITCDGSLEIDQKKNKAVLKDNVVAVQGDRTLKADEITVFFDPEAQVVSKMICAGNVEIIQGGNKTHSQRAVYEAATQKLTLTGQPKIILITSGEGSIASFTKDAKK
ncbi:MAG TPA: LPS export ABC transporter periplasmic protein LptC [Candidatus Omnitrophota bacterium]|nr:LPS export ABC transporter periplasmic protein LptC [Candidatus Omnitrophota bacterium]HQO57338.1 LPS export ABC transporter periplasmic protein LptC [Candidatus Omnitrophota bacterium]